MDERAAIGAAQETGEIEVACFERDLVARLTDICLSS
jgi:hypothetical protein